ncbi:MAG: aspartate-semialdehyde dehydrogenase [Planctomycetes bacterium]|nr:aspartate-semialdehyde dehydrogenase [Planctomycetota bacterium]MCH2585320.1 aspartate-semialdehyde dehydrogenase [Planctomycetota bacterium]|tara:strand:+ start:824 stop:1807 length:984 start_codon:yes stop_codon:yes gene_type:complete
MSSKSVAVVGVTGAVGQEMLDVLEARDFPLSGIRPLASERSAGKTVQFKGEELPVEVLGQDSFSGIDLALFSAGASISREYAPLAVDSGAVVVDNSSAFRMDPEIPLVVPEVNSGAIAGHQGIIANPNCSTIIMVVALQPIQELSPLTRVVVSTYQAASGAGAKGMDALRRELAGEQLDDSPFPHRLAGNLVPRIDVVQDDGYTKEELKMTLETRKIMGLGQVPISATCVRVPVERAHSESIQVSTESPLDISAIREAFEKAPGLQVIDDPHDDRYPTPLQAADQDDVFVGRLRQHPDEAATYDLWVVGDQIRKGAALNAVQIAEEL